MPRPRAIRPVSPLNVHLDADARDALDKLVSRAGVIPQGAYAAWINRAIEQAVNDRDLDLSPWLGTEVGEAVVRGHPMTIDALRKHLEKKA
jgi:hypothetical protein